MRRSLHLGALFAAVSCIATAGQTPGPQFLISSNDGKAVLADGVMVVPAPVRPDTVTIFDAGVSPPRLVAELQAPGSVVGPPQSVAIAPDQSIALVTSPMKLDPADGTKTIPDNRMTVIDLGASPPAILATLLTGLQPSGVSINRAGTLALVANRAEGTVSVFTVAGKTVTAAGKVDLGAPQGGPSHVAFTPDGATALVTRNNDHLISLLKIDGNNVSYAKQDILSGLKPYGVEVTPAGDIALAANTGAGPTGSADTISVIDLTLTPPRAVNQVAAGPIVEGISIAPDGRHVAVTVMNGSNLPAASPFFNDASVLKVYALSGATLTQVATSRLGRWCQGAAWRADGRRLFVQCMVEEEIQMFDFDGRTLAPAGSLEVSGGPAGLRTR